jgi:putative peptidoglycan lipid II flippase
VAFFIVPSAAAFLAVGDAVASLLFESGAFGRRDAVWVWQILAGSSIGLLAGTLGRLYASTFYALRDTRTPLRYALVRVALAVALGLAGGVYLPRWLGVDPRWGAAGLTGAPRWRGGWSSRCCGGRSTGASGAPAAVAYSVRLWTAAGAAAVLAWAVKLAWPREAPAVLGAVATLAAVRCRVRRGRRRRAPSDRARAVGARAQRPAAGPAEPPRPRPGGPRHAPRPRG